MKTFVAACCFSILSCAAFAQNATNDIESPSAAFAKGKMLRTGQFTFAQNAVIRNYVGKQHNPEELAMLERNACLTMRSYVFRRENRESDALQLKGEYVCTPAARFHAVPAK